jgi:hypothetical protein
VSDGPATEGITMTVTARHPSRIQFTCPAWCSRSREEHLEELGNFEGRCIHSSADRTGAGWYVAISSITYPDGVPADDAGVRVEVDTDGNIVLSAPEARTFALAILAAIEEARS